MKKGTWVLLAAIAILLVIVLVFPNGTKKLLRKAYQKLDSEYLEKVSDYDSIQKVRERDSIRFTEEYKYLNDELSTIIMEQEQELKRLHLRNYRNEQELSKYRNGDFDNKFKLFSRTIIRKDSI